MLKISEILFHLGAFAPDDPYRGAVAARIAWLLGVLLIVAGCAAAGFGRAAELRRGLDVAHDERRWTGPVLSALIPAGLASPAPLVVMMHGGFGSAQQAERAYGWDELAAARSSSWPIRRCRRAWNVGGCCGRPGREKSSTTWIHQRVVDDIAGHVTIDPKRRYATGNQQRRHAGIRAGVQHGAFAAIGPDSATQLDKCAAPHPTSVMHIHAQPTRGSATRAIPARVWRRRRRAVNADLNAFWRNGRPMRVAATTTDGAITTSTADCPDGRDVGPDHRGRRGTRVAVVRHAGAVGSSSAPH